MKYFRYTGNQKVCWEFLNSLYLTKSNSKSPGKRLVTKSGVPGHEILDTYWEYRDSCDWCGDDFFTREGAKTNFCSIECKQQSLKIKKFLKNIEKNRNKKQRVYRKNTQEFSVERRQKMSKSTKNLWKTESYRKKQALNSPQRQKTKINGYGMFNYYSKRLSLFKLSKRATNNSELLQIQCDICNEWYLPKVDVILQKIRNFKQSKFNKLTFCCSNKCRGVASGNCWDSREKKKKTYKYIIKFITPNQQLKVQKLKLKERLKEKKRLPYKRKKLISTLKKIKLKKIKEAKKLIPRPPVKTYQYVKVNDPVTHKVKRLLYYSRARAKQLKLPNTLKEEWIHEEIIKNCSVTGIKFNFENIVRDPFGPSIDRLDNSKGYTADNCRLTIWAFNSARNCFSDEEVYYVLKNFIEVYKKQGHDVIL